MRRQSSSSSRHTRAHAHAHVPTRTHAHIRTRAAPHVAGKHAQHMHCERQTTKHAAAVVRLVVRLAALRPCCGRVWLRACLIDQSIRGRATDGAVRSRTCSRTRSTTSARSTRRPRGDHRQAQLCVATNCRARHGPTRTAGRATATPPSLRRCGDKGTHSRVIAAADFGDTCT